MVKVLVRNEDPGMRRALEHALVSWNFQIVTVDDADQVCNVAALERPDFILLDFVEPGRVILETLKELKADPATRDLPVLVLSSSYGPLHRQQCLAVGASYYFDHHWTLEELRIRINLILGSGE